VFAETLNYLNMAIAIAIVKALSDYNVGIKWPNDFIINNKKVGGMLIEVIWKNAIEGIVVGISLNCNNSLKNDSLSAIATSLFDVTHGKVVDLEVIKSRLISFLNEWYDKWLLREFDLIFATWKALQLYLGKKISVHTKDGGILTGLMDSIDSEGNVIIDSENGKVSISFHSVENIIVS
jgi:BirA family transcriptional regulator, biotin operon repressor / biotin---[acetyl-CoA-carboxylase] ligase